MLPQIVNLAKRLPELRPHLNTEEATKNALVLPFIAALGYNVFDPTEVIPELVADVGVKKGEKVDYAIKHNGAIAMLIECKHVGAKLEDAQMSQLYRYFSVTKARIGILTNGVEYRFYSDLDAPNLMDAKPFFIFSLNDLREDGLAEVEKLSKERYDLETMLSTANNLKYARIIREFLEREFDAPSPDFVRIVFAGVMPGGRYTADNKALFTELTKQAVAGLIRDRVAARLRTALASEQGPSVVVAAPAHANGAAAVETGTPAPPTEVDDNGIVTTEEEIEGYHIVRSIVRTAVDAKRVVHRDTKSYMGILLDDNNRKPIVRLRFNYSTKYLGFPNADKSEEKVPIAHLDEIYEYSDRLLDTVKSYL